MKHRMIALGSLLIILGVGVGSIAQGQTSVADFYRGKRITWVVSAEPGGSTDVMTRILTPFVARETGTKIMVKNMLGGGVEGDNWVYNEAKRDGLTLLTEGTSPLLMNDVLKSPGVLYATEKFNFVSGLDPSGTMFAVSPKLPYRTLDALRKAKGLKAGASTARGYIAVCGVVTIQLLGLDAKLVTGYAGMKSVTLAVAQGEMDMVASSEKTLARESKVGTVVPLFIIGNERSPLVPEVPTLREFGVTVPKELTEACNMLTTESWAVALPPGVPEDRVAYLRNTFKRMAEMKDVQAEMVKWSGIWRSFIPGDKLQEHIRQIKGNKALAEQLEGLFKKYAATK